MKLCSKVHTAKGILLQMLLATCDEAGWGNKMQIDTIILEVIIKLTKKMVK